MDLYFKIGITWGLISIILIFFSMGVEMSSSAMARYYVWGKVITYSNWSFGWSLMFCIIGVIIMLWGGV